MSEAIEMNMQFYSTKQCWRCGYDLETDEHNRIADGKWWLRTGCPVCCYSFVE